MKLEEVRTIEKSHRIKPVHLSKTELIRTIQSGEYDRIDCFWREDCFASAHLHKGKLS
jgi:hypothetical protein